MQTKLEKLKILVEIEEGGLAWEVKFRRGEKELWEEFKGWHPETFLNAPFEIRIKK